MDKAIANDADFILMISNEKSIKDGVVVGSERFLRFRGDGYYSAGSRFQSLPEKIQLSTTGFVDAFNIAVKGASGLSDAELSKVRSEQEAARAKEVEAITLRAEQERERIVNNIKNHFMAAPDAVKADMVKKFAEYGINVKEANSNKVEALRAVAEIYGL